MVNNNRRTYGYCAKCGETKDIDQNYVHGHCVYPRRKGGFRFCAVCGKPWPKRQYDIRDYVCMDDLAKRAVTT